MCRLDYRWEASPGVRLYGVLSKPAWTSSNVTCTKAQLTSFIALRLTLKPSLQFVLEVAPISKEWRSQISSTEGTVHDGAGMEFTIPT